MRRSHSVRWAAVLAAQSLTPALAAQTAPAPGGFSDTLSLTDAEKAELMDHNSEDSVDAARAGRGVDLEAGAGTGLAAGAPDRKIHGEVGALIGSNGTRAAYGTAVVPVGDSATAAFSFERSHFGYPH